MRALRARLAVLACLSLLAAAPGALAAMPEILSEAVLATESGTRPVSLPHRLQPGDFAPRGSRVSYRLELRIADPMADFALYIPKISRSGRVILNGLEVGGCGSLPLEAMRCHHRPLFVRPPRSAWRPGSNLIEIEVFANHRQSNGLSAVTIGPADALYREAYLPRHLLQVGSIDALSWLTLGLGMLALLIHLQLREGRLYLWYGLTCLLAVISNLNILVTSPLIPFDPFDWVVFASRLAFTCLLGLTYLAYFKRDRPGYVRALLGYAVISPVLAWLFRLDPILISVLYLPLQLLGVTISVASLRWAWRSGTKSDWAMALTFLVVPVAGTLDLLRLRGGGSFTGVYVLVYSSALTLFLIGMGMISALAAALRTSRNLS